ncbi:cysteine/serine-rich nuclear protein 1b [Megalops cyprinoides]|uniref:cysteine/serine-rich nuclear protein 1b n=1 Tax=Megalops cyprinoides TaxID=118141 RepID=UPI001864E887|nr:cysteine/serine-rich nuclear protein 1b [Megalops cyprinoides]
MSGVLKRKFDEVDEDPCYSSSSPSSLSSSAFSEWDSDGESCYSDTLDSRPSNPGSPEARVPVMSILKKAKRARKGSVQFDQVTVFYFPRCQGFTSVPSRGGCTLGMVRQHSSRRQYTLAEFAVKQRQLRREKLKQRLKEEKLEALKLKLTKNGTQESEEADRLTVDDVSEDDIDISGVDLEDGFALHPYPSKRRHALLKAAGVKKIDKEEKRQLHDIRLSREDCGCNCQGFCEPETCACSLAGIKCQMDHSSFPCGCTKDGCGNTEGRIEFNSSRVQTHYIHTIMKLELEKRLEESSDSGAQAQRPRAAGGPLGDPREEDVPSVPAVPAFHFSSELAAAGENSCSSDMTDSSSSSGQSEDSEPAGSPDPGQAHLDVDDNGLARILSFSDSDNEDCSSSSSSSSVRNQRRPQRASGDFVNDNDAGAAGEHTDNRSLSLSEFLDENANQASALFHSGPVPHTPSPSVDHSASYMDLSLSSESDLEFLDGFPDYSPSPLYNSLRDYENLDNFFQFQLPSYPSFPQGSDSGTCFLESLIGLTESVPEPPATFTDNQLLEEAIKSSMMESVKV